MVEKSVKKKAAPPLERIRLRLKRPQDVAKYMARCIRRVEADGPGGDPNRAYKLVMMASMMLKAFEAGQMDERIARLEKAVETRGKR